MPCIMAINQIDNTSQHKIVVEYMLSDFAEAEIKSSHPVYDSTVIVDMARTSPLPGARAICTSYIVLQICSEV